MNRGSAKFLRAVSIMTGVSLKTLKRRWNAKGHEERARIRRDLPIYIAGDHPNDERAQSYAIFLSS